MPVQLILQQGKKPPFPYVLADVSEKNTILQVPSNNQEYYFVTGPTFGTAIPQPYTIVVIYFNDDNWSIYDTIIVPTNKYQLGLNPPNYPTSYIDYETVITGPIDSGNASHDPITNYEPMPSSVLDQTNTYIKNIYTYWIPNQQYYLASDVYSALYWSGPPSPLPPPANFAIARLLVVIT